MKTLLIVRHAKSSWSDKGISDIDRPLKKSGVNDATEVAQKLKQQKVSPDIIITSPAVRAITTAMIFARNLNYPLWQLSISEIAYDFTKDALLSIINTTADKYKTLMLVGHDPALTYLVNELTGEQFEKIPTSAVFTISFRVQSWKRVALGNGRLAGVESPTKGKKKYED